MQRTTTNDLGETRIARTNVAPVLLRVLFVEDDRPVMPPAVDIIAPCRDHCNEDTVLRGPVHYPVDILEVCFVRTCRVGVLQRKVAIKVWACRTATNNKRLLV